MSRSCELASSSCRSRYFAFLFRLEMSSCNDFSCAVCFELISDRGCSMNLGSASARELANAILPSTDGHAENEQTVGAAQRDAT